MSPVFKIRFLEGERNTIERECYSQRFPKSHRFQILASLAAIKQNLKRKMTVLAN